MPAGTELANAEPHELAERPVIIDPRWLSEAFATLLAQDAQLVADAVREGYFERLQESLRLCPTGQVDGDDHAPSSRP